jgi:SulP family sulfate permease
MPMASLAGLLVFVAYGMFDAKHFFHCLKVSPKSDKAVLLACFALTITFDMVIGVTVGVVLAALLFIQRMSQYTKGSQWTGTHHKLTEPMPEGIMVYEIAGPLFFGAAEKAIEGSKIVNKDIKSVVFNLESVPTMDLTGLVAFESAILDLLSRSVSIHISGVNKQPLQLLKKSKVLKSNPQIQIENNLHDAISFAKTDLLKTLI